MSGPACPTSDKSQAVSDRSGCGAAAFSSAPVASRQTGPHPRLDEVVRRHLHHRWRKPVATHTRRAFARIAARIATHPGPLILDSGCGTAASTAALARHHRHALVVGIDKSAARLARTVDLPENAVCVRAELADFWRLAVAHCWRPQRHYLWYPNPWPKPEHLLRRWHAHPVFPDLLALGGYLEVRSNWQVYIEEFARALAVAGQPGADCQTLDIDQPVSPFERKYAASGHVLYAMGLSLER